MGFLDRLFGRAPEQKSGDITSSHDLAKLVQPSTARVNMPAYNYFEAADTVYSHNAVGYASVNLIAQNAAAVDLDVFKGDVEIDDRNNPLVKLLKRPNPSMGGARFVQELVAHLLLSGNAYITRSSMETTNGRLRYDLLARGKGEMYSLNPAYINVVQGGGMFPLRYLYTPPGVGAQTFEVDQTTGKCELLHLKLFHPSNRFMGLPAASAAWAAVLNHNAGTEWNYAQLKNNAVPSMVLSLKDGSTLTPEQAREFAAEFSRLYGGGNAGKTAVIGEFDATTVGFDPTKMEYIEGLHSAARLIALAYGVPPMLLGIPGDNTFSNMQSAIESLYHQRVFPLLDYILDEMSMWMAPVFGDDIRLDYDIDSVPALEQSRQAVFMSLKDASFLTVNEKRALIGFDPLPGAEHDQLIQPPAMGADPGKDPNKPDANKPTAVDANNSDPTADAPTDGSE